MARILIFTTVFISLMYSESEAQISEIENKLFLRGSIPSLYLQGETNVGQNGLRLHKSGNDGYIDHKGTGNLYFRLDNSAASSIRMTLASNGKVGIGTTSLAGDALLTLNGNLRLADDADIFGLDQVVGFNDLQFYGDPNGGPDMLIDAAGRIGLGAVQSFAKLNIRALASGTAIILRAENSVGTPKFQVSDAGAVGINEWYSNVSMNVRGRNGDDSHFRIEDLSGQKLVRMGGLGDFGSSQQNLILYREGTPNYGWILGNQSAAPSATDNDFYFTVIRNNVASHAGHIQDSENNVQMNFTGQHRSLIEGVDFSNPHRVVEELEGLIVVADKNQYMSMSGGLKIGQSAIMTDESLPIVSLSSKKRDKSVFGVISNVESDTREDAFGAFVTPHKKEEGDQRVYINSAGEGAIWVLDAEGDLESGDYIVTSEVPGYGMRQEGEFLANYTVAKITMDCNFQPKMEPVRRIKKEKIWQEEQWVEKNALDEFGRLIWEPVCDTEGSIQYEPAYKIRYLLEDGTPIEKPEYEFRKSQGEKVYRAAFVGCTYHCG